MDNNEVILNTNLPLRVFYKGKVRDTYDLGDLLLVIATDRISAFDVVLSSGIPRKGLVLNQLSNFWFKQTSSLVPNHLVEVIDDVKHLDAYIPSQNNVPYPTYLEGRSTLVKKAKRIPVECVVRGYLAGAAWTEYQKYGAVSGIPLPKGLRQSEEFPEPLFTPTTKADTGHDEPISMDEMKKLAGEAWTEKMRKSSLAIYNYARKYALERDIIVADTKMEFGLDGDKLILIDELLTPDSSRFWDVELYVAGKEQPSYDKQPVRDWLVHTGWNKEPPAPILTPEVITNTTERYTQAYVRLTGKQLTHA